MRGAPLSAASGLDFTNDRLTQPLIRKDGQLAPSTWEEAFELIGKILDARFGTDQRCAARLDPTY